MAADWQNVAIALGFDQARIKTIETNYPARAEDACREIFVRWLNGEHDLAKPTWNTLINALQDAGLATVAISLKLKTTLRQQ